MSNQKENPQQLAQRINNLIPYYEFSDSQVLWNLEHEKLKAINRLLRNAGSEEKKAISQNLNTKGKLNYDRYFSKTNLVNVPSVFELNSIKDQLSLLAALSSHIDIEAKEDKELDPDFEQLLRKMDNTTKNLSEKFKHLKMLLDN